MDTNTERQGAKAGDEPVGSEPIDVGAAARGAIYALLARGFEHPDESFHEALEDGSIESQLVSLLDQTGLSVTIDEFHVEHDYDTLCARYNDLFIIGFSEYENPADGTLRSTDPPIPLYESAYRSDVSWSDVNLDLARAYDYYDVTINEKRREHHDHLQLQLEFAGYLARREAVVDGASAAAARLDFLDRHLRILIEGIVDRTHGEPGTGIYAKLVDLLDAFTASDRDELANRLEGDET
ncbi:molecular chaperone TorD family protein [Haladaptatus sp. NG-SE-30]